MSKEGNYTLLSNDEGFVTNPDIDNATDEVHHKKKKKLKKKLDFDQEILEPLTSHNISEVTRNAVNDLRGNSDHPGKSRDEKKGKRRKYQDKLTSGYEEPSVTEEHKEAAEVKTKAEERKTDLLTNKAPRNQEDKKSKRMIFVRQDGILKQENEEHTGLVDDVKMLKRLKNKISTKTKVTEEAVEIDAVCQMTISGNAPLRKERKRERFEYDSFGERDNRPSDGVSAVDPQKKRKRQRENTELDRKIDGDVCSNQVTDGGPLRKTKDETSTEEAALINGDSAQHTKKKRKKTERKEENEEAYFSVKVESDCHENQSRSEREESPVCRKKKNRNNSRETDEVHTKQILNQESETAQHTKKSRKQRKEEENKEVCFSVKVESDCHGENQSGSGREESLARRKKKNKNNSRETDEVHTKQTLDQDSKTAQHTKKNRKQRKEEKNEQVNFFVKVESDYRDENQSGTGREKSEKKKNKNDSRETGEGHVKQILNEESKITQDMKRTGKQRKYEGKEETRPSVEVESNRRGRKRSESGPEESPVRKKKKKRKDSQERGVVHVKQSIDQENKILQKNQPHEHSQVNDETDGKQHKKKKKKRKCVGDLKEEPRCDSEKSVKRELSDEVISKTDQRQGSYVVKGMNEIEFSFNTHPYVKDYVPRRLLKINGLPPRVNARVISLKVPEIVFNGSSINQIQGYGTS